MTAGKQKYRDEKYAGIRDKEAFHEAGIGTRFDRSDLLKDKVASGTKLSTEEAEEARTIWSGTNYSSEQSEALRKNNGFGYNEDSMKKDITSKQYAANIAVTDLSGISDKDEDGNIVIAENERAREQGKMLAQGFLQLTTKEQDTAIKAMTKDNKESMLVNVAALDKEKVREATPDQDLTKIETEEDSDGNIVRKKVANEDSAEFKRTTLLAKYKPKTKESQEAYEELQTAAGSAGKNEADKNLELDDSSLHKSMAKGMEGSDLAKMKPDSSILQGVAVHLSNGQMKSMSDEGAKADLMEKVVELKGNQHEDDPDRRDLERRRLRTNPVTRAYAEKLYGTDDAPTSTGAPVSTEQNQLTQIEDKIKDLQEELNEAKEFSQTTAGKMDIGAGITLGKKKVNDLEDQMKVLKTSRKSAKDAIRKGTSKAEKQQQERDDLTRESGGKIYSGDTKSEKQQQERDDLGDEM
jgi:hypothetical protein